MKWFTGVIEDINDPKKMNRVKVRAFGIHTDVLAKVSTASLPWATVMLPTTSSGMNGLHQTPHGLLCGSWVVGFFRDGDACQDPIVMGSIASMSTHLPDTSLGFYDPNGEYPRETHIDESDVNRLARGEDKEEDIVRKKKDSITKEIPTAVDEKWNEPETPYAPVYPFNKVYESTSGHIQEIDDTEGAERLHNYHRSGTFEEIHPDGTKVTRVVMDEYEIVYGNSFVNVKGNVNLTIDANCNTYIKGDWHVKVDKNMTVEIGGELKETVSGNVSETYGGNQQTQVSGNVDVNATNIYLN